MKQKRNNHGFTLAELLIVVAIIAVLVAISIPIFSSQLEKSKQAVDLANMRSAKAAAISEYYFEGNYTGEYKYNYDANAGMVTTDVPSGYGKSKELTYDGITHEPLDKYVVVTIDENSVLVEWSDSSTPITNSGGNTISGGGGITIPDIPDTPDTPSNDDEGDGNSSGGNVSPSALDYINDNSNINRNNSEWPTDGSGKLTYDMGQVFVYNDEYYVAHSDMHQEYGNGWVPKLEELNSAVKISNHKIKTSADVVMINNTPALSNVDTGDIYVNENGDVFIRAFGSGNINLNSGEWRKISK